MRAPDESSEDIRAIRISDDQPGAHVTDAKALYDLLSRRSGNAGQDRRPQIDVAVIFISAQALKVTTYWVPGSIMIADPLTKRLGNGALLRQVMKDGFYHLTKQAAQPGMDPLEDEKFRAPGDAAPS